jgi:hypothetical protein
MQFVPPVSLLLLILVRQSSFCTKSFYLMAVKQEFQVRYDLSVIRNAQTNQTNLQVKTYNQINL